MTAITAMNMTAHGSHPQSLPEPIQVNSDLRPDMGTPSMMTRTIPRNMLLVPKVAIKGTIPSTVMTKALNAPNAMPVPSAISMATGTGIPAFMAEATTRPENATPEPTDSYNYSYRSLCGNI